jgi:hypothetical protein
MKNSSSDSKECVFKYFLKATWNFAFHSSELSECVVNCWKFWGQHKMYFSENKIGWHLVYEDGADSLY